MRLDEFHAWLRLVGFIPLPTLEKYVWLKEKDNGDRIKLWISMRHTTVRYKKADASAYGQASLHRSYQSVCDHITNNLL